MCSLLCGVHSSTVFITQYHTKMLRALCHCRSYTVCIVSLSAFSGFNHFGMSISVFLLSF